MNSHIPYAKQVISQEDIKGVIKTLKSDFLTQGKKTVDFEKKLTQYTKSKFAVSLNSATSALQLSYLSLGLEKDDLILTSPISFVATTNAALHCGAKVDFIDIDNTFCIDVDKLESNLKIRKKNNQLLPKIVIPVHLGGFSCRMKEINYLSKKYNFKVVEDASHAIGGTYNNHKIGSCKYSDLTVFSFHPVKIITTGEGGAVLTNKNYLYKKILSMRSHGIIRNKNSSKKFWLYKQKNIGWNYRMNDIQASLGITQLKKINNFIKIRKDIAHYYYKELKDLPLKFQYINKKTQPSWHLFVIQVDQEIRDKLFYFLKSRNIQSNLHYIPIYKHPYYKSNYKKKSKFDYSEKYYSSSISLPMHAGLKKTQQKKIIRVLKEFFKKN